MNRSEFPGIAGLVLAGGRSRRMGADKATLLLPEGRTFLENAFSLLSSLVSPCHISCRPDQAYSGFPSITDKIAGKGPAGGIYSGLLEAAGRQAEALLVLACDLPCMDKSVLKRLLTSHAAATASAPLVTVWLNPHTNRREMTAAIYSIRAIPLFLQAFQNGNLALHSIIPREMTLLLTPAAEEKRFFQNCNTPDDYLILKRNG